MADEASRAPRYLPGGTYSTIAHDEHSAPGFLFSHGSRAYLYTTGGSRLLDVMLGHGSLLLGHSHPAVVEAVKRQVELGNTFTHVTGPAIRLAEMIVEHVPCAEMVRFVNSGTEAVMLALRTARAHTGRDKVLKFEGAYHGFADGVLFSTNYGRHDRWPDHPQPDPDSPGIPSGHAHDILIAPWNDIDATREIVSGQPRRPRRDHCRARHARPRLPPRLPGADQGGGLRGRRAAHLRRGRHRLPARPRRRAGVLRRDARTSPPSARAWAPATP